MWRTSLTDIVLTVAQAATDYCHRRDLVVADESPLELESTMKAHWDSRFLFIAAMLLIAVVSFPWWHSHPAAADMPMHIGSAKAFADLASGDVPADYPYEIALGPGPYQGAQFILAAFVVMLGPVTGAKAALSVYALLTVLSVGYLAVRINPNATWERLAGVPLALNYFFHWGFWPFLMSLPLAYFAIAYSLRERHTIRTVPVGSLLRFGLFLLHPITAIAVGLVDILIVLVDVRDRNRWLRPAKWRWAAMVGYWLVPGTWATVGFLLSGGAERPTGWGTLAEQAIQLMRPIYITQHWWEGLIPFLGWAVLAFAAIVISIRRRIWPGVWIAGAFVILVGLVFPRDGFVGGWELGGRLVLIGMVVIAAAFATPGLRLSRLVLAWVVVATALNLAAGHVLWHRHSQSMHNLVTTMAHEAPGAVVSVDIVRRPNQPSVDFGRHAGVWAWCLGIAGDAYNDVASENTFGPVRHRRLDLQADPGGPRPVVEVVFHPYGTDEVEVASENVLYQDSVYTMYRVR